MSTKIYKYNGKDYEVDSTLSDQEIEEKNKKAILNLLVKLNLLKK